MILTNASKNVVICTGNIILLELLKSQTEYDVPEEIGMAGRKISI
jgi:hypothetical protein